MIENDSKIIAFLFLFSKLCSCDVQHITLSLKSKACNTCISKPKFFCAGSKSS